MLCNLNYPCARPGTLDLRVKATFLDNLNREWFIISKLYRNDGNHIYIGVRTEIWGEDSANFYDSNGKEVMGECAFHLMDEKIK